MDLVLTYDGREYRVEVRGRQRLEVKLEGRTFTYEVHRQGDEVVLSSEGFTHRARVEGHRLLMDGRPVDVAVKGLGGSSVAVAAGEGAVLPPMPGRVISVLVKPGDRVSRGTPLLVLEAMKMQNEIPAPTDGIVREVRVLPGQGVGAGDVLVVLEALMAEPSEGS